MMNQEKFKRIIKKELKKLDREQAINFSWRCSMRALPFLGSYGSFDFWKKKDRQKHIYAIFYALDVNAANATYAAAAAASAAFRASDAAFAAASAATYAASRATYAAASAATNATYAAAAGSASAFRASDAACDAASAATYATTITATIKGNIDLESIILDDLRSIKGKGNEEQHISIELYGEIWDSFQNALEAEGCAYWGKLYKNIFDNQFELDQKALDRRMNIPKEIRMQGAAAVANFLEEIEEKGAIRLNETRIIILGDKGAGKTCIARKLIDTNAPMTTDAESTAGVDTTLWKLEKENINVRIWDFAGHTVTHAVHQFFLSERCLYLLVYDGRTEERNRLEYWLDHMKNYGGDSSAILLVNKRDQHSVDIPINSLKEQYPIAGVYTFSIKDGKTDLEAFRNDVVEYIENNPTWKRQEIPKNYYQVKEELENLFFKGKKGKGEEYITKERFDEIANRHDVDNMEELLKDLHFLGVSLWYKDMENFDTLILNPEWISQGVYKIINWVNEEKKYSLNLDDFATVFSENLIRYPIKRHEFLFELMKHYELAYETQNEGRLIIPHLLKEDRPVKLPVFPVGESLMLRYEADQPLPPNTITRFIVRHNQEIKTENKKYIVWRYGVVLEDGNGSLALVREEDRTISVSVKGREKTNYISALRETLNDIFNSYESDKPKLKYRIERFGGITDIVETGVPLWLRDRKILNHYEREKPYYDDATDRDIPLADVVNIYNIKAENVIYGGQGHRIIKTTFNFSDCNINLQGNLNELAQLLAEGGNEEEAKELENAAQALGKAEKCKSKEELKKKGIANKLKRLAVDLGNADSKLHKTVKGIKHGIRIAQEIAKGCNDIAQWAGLP